MASVSADQQKYALATALKLSITTLLALTLLACQPKDVRPGFWLSGKPVTEKLDSWTFTDQIEEVFIQTKPWYGLPHSATIWCATYGDNLYIGSYGTDKKTWEKNIAADPQATIAIAGKLYSVVVNPVTDNLLAEKIAQRYNSKYDMTEVFGEDLPTWWFYQLEQRVIGVSQ